MSKVNVTFNHENVKGTLQFEVPSEELEDFKKRAEIQVGWSTPGLFYAELGAEIEKSMTIQQVHELPTEEGLYLDKDGGVWRINDQGIWIHLHAYDPPRVDPDEYKPFTKLKLGRVY